MTATASNARTTSVFARLRLMRRSSLAATHTPRNAVLLARMLAGLGRLTSAQEVELALDQRVKLLLRLVARFQRGRRALLVAVAQGLVVGRLQVAEPIVELHLAQGVLRQPLALGQAAERGGRDL